VRRPHFQFDRTPLELAGFGAHAHLIAEACRPVGFYVAIYLGPFVFMASWSWR
jgi:hypothetical protein